MYQMGIADVLPALFQDVIDGPVTMATSKRKSHGIPRGRRKSRHCLEDSICI